MYDVAEIEPVLLYLTSLESSENAWLAHRSGGQGFITFWDDAVAGRAQPDNAEVNATAASPEYAAWLAERGGDPILTHRRLGREFINSGEGAAIVDRAFANVERQLNNEVRVLVTGIRDAFVNNANSAQIRDAIIALPALSDVTISKAEFVQLVIDDINAGNSDAPV